MAQPEIPLQLRMLTEAVRPVLALDAGQESPPQFSGFAAGLRLQARVGAALPDGGFKVFIAGQALDVNLPPGHKTGDKLELVYVAREPRLTFLLAESEQQQPARLTATARLIAQLPSSAGAPTGFFAASSGGLPGESIMGPTGAQGLAQTLQHAANSAPGARTAPPLLQSAPLLAVPPAGSAGAAELASALSQALELSGMFYESHQARWAAGERPLERLLREPQALFSPRLQLTGPAAAPEAGAGPTGAAATAKPSAAARGQPEGIEPALATIVGQQLETLASGKLIWQGEVWPGQRAQWEVMQQEVVERDAGNGAPDAQAGFATRLALYLPALGEVHASLELTVSGLRLGVSAASPGGAAALRARGAALAQALQDAGIRIVAMQVSEHAAP